MLIGAVEVDPDHSIDVGELQLVEGDEGLDDARVVDQTVDRTEGGGHPVGECGARRPVGDVGDHEPEPVVDTPAPPGPTAPERTSDAVSSRLS